MIAIIGTSDRPCWLAEACKILLLLQYASETSNMWSATLHVLMLYRIKLSKSGFESSVWVDWS